jgi:hypothetical protein
MSRWRWRLHLMRRRAARIWTRQLGPRLVAMAIAAVSGPLLFAAFAVLSSPGRPYLRSLVPFCVLLLFVVAGALFGLLTGMSIDDLVSPQRSLFPPAHRRRVALAVLFVAVFVVVLLAFVGLAVVARAP